MGGQSIAALAPGQTDARREPRFRVLLLARLVTTSGERIVKLRDLSAMGAMIEGDRLPPPGTDVLLRRGALELIATLLWAKDGKAGLEFDEPLTQAELWMQVNAPQLDEEPAPAPPVPPADPIAPFNRSFSRQ
jgi:hypothetical protein